MENYNWIEKYSVGVKTIDEQHQHYLEMVNDIVKITGQNIISPEEITAKIDDLNNYAIYHFTTEENFFKKYNYSGAEKHLAEHRAFEEKLDEFINKAKQGGAEIDPTSLELNETKKIILEIAEFAGSWLINHVMNMDQKYVGFMHENGIK